jgi:hypothetical protein
MFSILVHKLVEWVDAAQHGCWDSYLTGSCGLIQAEQRIRELEGSQSRL